MNDVDKNPDAAVRFGMATPQEQHEFRIKLAGDKLKAFLDERGYTQEWYKAIKAKHGLPPTCHCPEMQEWMNKVDRSMRRWSSKGVEWARRFWEKLGG